MQGLAAHEGAERDSDGRDHQGDEHEVPRSRDREDAVVEQIGAGGRDDRVIGDGGEGARGEVEGRRTLDGEGQRER